MGTSYYDGQYDPITGNRTSTYTYKLWDNFGHPLGSLSGVTGGSLEWHSNAAVKGGGRITVKQDDRHDNDWLNLRVKVYMNIDGEGEYPLGVFIPSAPSEDWSEGGLELTVELLDKCSVLDQDSFGHTYSLPKGTVITDKVRELILSTGESAGSITDSNDMLDKAMTWEPGTSKLTIINDLLAAGNFFSLKANGDGHFLVQKQRLPRDRPVAYKFFDNYESIYVPEFTYERDIYSIPNKVVMVEQGDGDKEGRIGIATNTNPKSPYSYQNRGNRWITDTTTGVDAATQQALDDMAQRRLIALTNPTGTITIDHAPLPWLQVDDVVRFRRTPADIDSRCVVSSMAFDLNGLSLCHTELQEVAEL